MKIMLLTYPTFCPDGKHGPKGAEIHFAPYEIPKLIPHITNYEILRDIVCELGHVHDYSWRELALRGLSQRPLVEWLKDYALIIAFSSQLESLKQSIDLQVIHETGCRYDSVLMIEDHK